MRDTIEMAQEAQISDTTIEFYQQELKAFEALVRADEQEKYKWDIHSCGPTCNRYACVAMREAVEAEREACAKVCDALVMGKHCAAAIRARGNT
jgi:hypothetical protein